MAEITENKSVQSRGLRRGIKKILRPDLTAMVDVAFLLLTFFVMTSQMKRDANMMVLALPPSSTGKVDVNQEKMLTLIPAENNMLFYYFGRGDSGIQAIGYGKDGVRKLVQAHMYHDGATRCTGTPTGKCWDPIVVIKPRKKAKYGNLVDVLDEMKIAAVPKYAVLEFTENDSLLWLATAH